MSNNAEPVESVSAEEEEEEEDPECPLPGLREKCAEEKKCAELKVRMETCNERVSSKTKTEETCHEEMLDFMHCVDHCAMPKVFRQLK